MQLTQNTVLITGGSSGIGRALAERFSDLGNRVIICGRNEEALRKVQEKRSNIHIRVFDTGKSSDRVSMWRELTHEFSKINVLINNAGIQRKFDLAKGEPWAETQQEIAINFEGPVHLSSLFIPHLLQQERPAILNVSSGLAFVAMASAPVYCATKAAIHSFTLSLRHQLRKTPIEVIEIIPPAVRTNLGGSHDFGVPLDEYADSVMTQLKEGRLEVTYGTSAKSSQASRAEIDQIFKTINGD
jgi:uncharacterized oxidoreductase